MNLMNLKKLLIVVVASTCVVTSSTFAYTFQNTKAKLECLGVYELNMKLNEHAKIDLKKYLGNDIEAITLERTLENGNEIGGDNDGTTLTFDANTRKGEELFFVGFNLKSKSKFGFIYIITKVTQ
jgi:hypothetical protein